MGRRRALLVHNSKFIDPALAPLTAASGDVRKLAELLQADFVGFDPDEITLLENPSLGDFRAEVSRFYRDAKRDDYLFFYYAGHGIRGDAGELYLALRNTTLENYEALALEASFIRRNLERCFAKKKVLLLDCCNASAFREDGRFTARDAQFDAGQMVSNFDPKGTGTYILGASQSGSSAYETVDQDGNAYSLFTRHLIEGVTTGQAAPDRASINWTDIGAYIHSQRKIEGILTNPYIDMTNAEGLLEFCKNPTFGTDIQVGQAPVQTEQVSTKRSNWPLKATGVVAVSAIAGIAVWTLNKEQPLPNTPPQIEMLGAGLAPQGEDGTVAELSTATTDIVTATAPILKPVQATAPLTFPTEIQPINPFSTFPDAALSHDQLCEQDRGILIDVSDPTVWAKNLATGGAVALVDYQTDGANQNWLSLSDASAQNYDAYEFNIEFCSCVDGIATAQLSEIRADDSAQLFLGGDDFVGTFEASSDRETMDLTDTNVGTRALTVVVDNGVRGGRFGFYLQGTLRAEHGYLGQCRDRG